MGKQDIYQAQILGQQFQQQYDTKGAANTVCRCMLCGVFFGVNGSVAKYNKRSGAQHVTLECLIVACYNVCGT